MIVRLTLFILLVIITTAASAQQKDLPVRKTVETAKRSIRFDVPMTNSIRKAFKEGTRDFPGRPGPNYWQPEADYTIKASLDPATQTITGSEKISMHNNSKDDLKTIVLRLDHNIFRPEARRGASVPAEATEGMVLTGLKVAGQPIGLNNALEFYSKLWAPYPFPQFTMQDGPGAGMEYPMVIDLTGMVMAVHCRYSIHKPL